MSAFILNTLTSDVLRATKVSSKSFQTNISAAQYKLLKASSEILPQGIELKKEGGDLQIWFDGELLNTLTDFYLLQPDTIFLSLEIWSEGELLVKIDDVDLTESGVWHTDFISSALLSSLTGGVVVLGVKAYERASDSDSNEPQTTKLTITPITETDANTSLVKVYDHLGNEIGTGLTDPESDQVQVEINSAYSGPVLVVVTNTEQSDNTAEPTGSNSQLRLVTELNGSEDLFLSVTPLTELSTRLSGVPDNPEDLAFAPLTTDNLIVNQQVAQLFGLESLTGEVLSLDESLFDSSDGLSESENYGQTLALLSGLDEETGSMSATLTALQESLGSSDGTPAFTVDTISLLASAEKTLLSGDYASKYDVSASILSHLPTMTGAEGGLTEKEINQGLEVSFDNANVGDTVTILIGTESYTTVLTEEDVNEGQANILVPATVLQALEEGEHSVQLQVNDEEVSSPVSLTLDFTAPASVQFNLAADSGTSTEDFLSNSGVMAVTLAEDSVSWEYSLDSGETWIQGTGNSFELPEGQYPAGSIQVRQQDSAGNVSIASANTESLEIDQTAPNARLEISTEQLAAGEQAQVSIYFSEPVTDFTLADLTVTSGTLTGLASPDGGLTWTATYVPAEDIQAETISIQLKSDFADLAGNLVYEAIEGGSADSVSASLPITVDTCNPNASIELSQTESGPEQSALVTIRFSEAVENFSAEDLIVGAGTIEGLASDDGGLTWTAQFVPLEGFESAANQIQLSRNWNDQAGNQPQTITQSETYLVDWSAPAWLSETTASIEENSDPALVVYQSSTTDMSAIRYSLTGADADFFVVDPQTGAVKFNEIPDADSQASYQITLAATDRLGNVSQLNLVVSVTDLDESRPVFTSGNTATAIDENSGAGQVIYTAVATDTADIDDDTDTSSALEYSLSGTDEALFSIDRVTGEVTLIGDPNHEAKASYSFDVTATDLAGNSQTQTVTLAINDLDESRPVFTSSTTATAIDENSGAGQIVYTAVATDTADIDDDTDTSSELVYSLSGTDEALFSIDRVTGEVTLIGDPNNEAKASYSFDVTATDLAGNSQTQTVALAINDLDESAPMFTLGTTATAIDENSGAGQVIYTATATDTADIDDASDASTLLTYRLAGTDAGLFTIDAQSGEVTPIGNPNHEAKASYSFDVITTDGNGNQDRQTVTLAVNDLDESRPVFTSGTSATAIDENSGAGQVIYTTVAIDTADIDDATDSSSELVYSLSGTDEALFSIDRVTGEVTLIGAPNHEAKASYSFDVTAIDLAGNSQTQTVTLAINDLDESRPVFTSGTTATAIDENSGAGQVIYTAVATDTADIDDATDTSSELVYSLGGSDEALFSIDRVSGEVTLIGDPNHEAKVSYSFDVTATDLAGNSQTQTVTLAINNLDDTAPAITSGTNANNIDEHSGADQIVYVATSDDTADISNGVVYSLDAITEETGDFSIDADTGEVSFHIDPDYEVKSSYSFGIVVTDLAGNSSQQQVVLAINDLDDSTIAPVIQSSGTLDTVSENIASGSEVYRVVSTDNEDVENLQFSISGNDADKFSIDTKTGVVTFTEAPDFETQSSFQIEVIVTDSDGNTTSKTLDIELVNQDDTAPVITSGTSATTIEENTSTGQIVYTASADDSADISDGVTFSLSGPDASHFSIDEQTGDVVLNESPDFETQDAYQFDVVATDGAGNSSRQTVTLNVNNQDELPPEFTSSTVATPIIENSGTNQIVYQAEVDDSHDVSAGVVFSLGGDDASLFGIDSQTGAVTLMEDPDYESRTSYNFDITVTDSAGFSSTQTVTLEVVDINGSDLLFTSAAETSVDENQPESTPVYQANVAVPDVSETGGLTQSDVRYSLAGTDAAAFSINEETGEVFFLSSANHESQASYQFSVVATLGAATSTHSVILQINDRDESAPTITSGTIATEIDENTGAGTVVYTATATDTRDLDDSAINNSGITFALAGEDASYFDIDAVSGEVTLINDANHELKGEYLYEVVASDSSGNSSSLSVVLTVNDIDESAPRFPLTDYTDAEYVVAWASKAQDSQGRFDIYAQVFDDEDNKVNSEFLINSITEGAQYFPAITALDDGGFAVAWDDWSDDAEGLYIQLYNEDGFFKMDPVTIYGELSSWFSKVDELDNGNLVILWRQYYSQENGERDSDVFGYILNQDGEAIKESFHVNTVETGFEGIPSLVQSVENNGWLAFWAGEDESGGVYSQRYNSNGDPVGSYYQVGDGNVSRISSDYRNNGFVYLAWKKYETSYIDDVSTTRGEIYLQGIDFYGAPLDEAFLVRESSDSNSIPIGFIDVRVLDTGDVVVTWDEVNDDGEYDVYLRIVDSNLDYSGQIVQVNQYSIGSQSIPKVEVLNNGNFLIVWSSQDQDGSDYGVYAQRFDYLGNKVGQEFRINTVVDNYQALPVIATLSVEQDAPVTIDENISLDTVVYTVYAYDTADIDDVTESSSAVSYSLKNGDAEYLSIDSLSGDIRFLSSPDYEFKTSYTFDVVATDAAGNSAQNTMTIYINDIDETLPVFTSGTTATAINENSESSVVYTATSNDSDATYTLSGADAAAFTINNGEVTFTGGADHETQSQYEFTITATNSEGGQTSQTVTMSVNDTDDSAPVFTTGSSLGNGGFVVTWTSDGQDGSYEGVYGQRYDGNGTAVGSEFQINTYTSNSQIMPSVTTLMDGGFVVTWASGGQDGSGYGIYGQRYDIDGNTVGSEFQINSYTSSYQYEPSVTALADGGFVVSWDSYQDGSYEGLYGQRYDAFGNTVGSEFQINTYTYRYQRYADVASLENGGFVVTWSSDGQDGSSYGIYGQRYDADGNASGNEFKINTYTSSGQLYSSVTELLDGGFVVTWESYAQDSSSDGIYGQRYDADGNTVGSEFQINTYTSDYQENSSVTALLNGGFVVAWESDNQDGSRKGVYGQLFDADGNAVGSEFQINTYTYYHQYMPSVSALDNGEFVVTWASYQDGSGYGIYGQRFDADGNTVGNEFQVNTYTISAQDEPDVAGFATVLGNGNAIVDIDENVGANQVVYTANATDTLDTDDDTDNSANVTYSLSGTDADLFSLDEDSGELVLLEDPDYETQSSYEVVITATDDSGNSRSQNVTVDVNNLDELPVITSGITATAVDENSESSVVYTATSNDPDATYTLSGTDAAAFTINNGEVTFTGGADHETQSQYEFTITATNSEGGQTSQTVTMAVNDNDDSAPVFTTGSSLGNGGFVVTWASYGQDGSFEGIYGQRYDIDGYTVGNEFHISSYTNSRQKTSAVATLVDGSFVVTWASDDLDGSGYGIYGQRYDADGHAVGSEFQINTYTWSYQISPSVTALTDGGFWVSWNSHSQDGNSYGVYGQRYDASGNAVGGEFQVNTYTSYDQWLSDTSSLSDGGFVVTWSSNLQDGSAYGIYGQRYSADGNVAGSEFQVNTYSANNQAYSSVAGLLDGGFVVTWESYGQDSSYDGIYGQRYDANGNTLGSEFQINTTTIDDQENSSVTALLSGGFVVTWESDNQDGSGEGVYGQLFDADGNAVGSEFLINTTTYSDQYQPSVSALDDGGFVVTWASRYQDYSSTYGIYGQRFDDQGNTVGDEFQVNTYTSNNQDEPDVFGFTALFGNGNAIVDVDENVGSNQVVYTANATDTLDTDDNTDNSANVTYSLSGTDADHFSLDEDSGELVLLDDPDYETQSSYEVVITATDDSGNSRSQKVTVDVNKLYDGPTITSGATASAIKENSGAGQVIYTITSEDEYAVYSLSGDDTDLFSIDSSTGEVILIASPDAENKSSYSFGVTATDQHGQISVQMVTLTIIDLDESAPVFTTGVTLGNGGFVVTWTSYGQDGSYYGSNSVYGQRYDSGGNTVGGEFQINTYTSDQQETPSVTTLMDGGFVVTWESYNQDSYYDGIYGQRYDVDGNKVGSEFQVNTYTTNDQFWPSVTALADGGFVITWSSDRQDGSRDGIYGQRYDADSNAIGDEFQINTYTSYDQNFSDIASLSDGGFVVAWSSSHQDGESFGIYGQLYDAHGNTVGREFLINTYTSSRQSSPSVLGLLDGGFVVTWESSSQDGSSFGIYGQRYDVDGNTVGSEFQINTHTRDDQEGSSATALLNGGFVVTWESDNQDGSGEGVYGQLFDADGNTVGSEILINTTTYSTQYQPSVSALDDGGFVVTWTSRHQDGSVYGVYGQRFDDQGNMVGSEFQVNTYTSGAQDEPDVAGFVQVFGAQVSIDENAGANQLVYTANVTDTLDTDDDTDNSANVTYSLSGTDADLFSLDEDSGELVLLEDPDYETQSSYDVIITATDDSSNSASQTVYVSVNDLVEPGEVLG